MSQSVRRTGDTAGNPKEKRMSYDDGDHADAILASGEPGGDEQDDNGRGNGGDGQTKLVVIKLVFVLVVVDEHNHELHGEAQEEQEVKLEQGNVDLYVTSLSSALVCCDSTPHVIILTWKARYLRFMRRSALMCL